MHKLVLGLAATAFLAVPAMAQTPLTFADVDSNGDGRLSYEELQVVWPDLTPEEFSAADIESAGSLTPDQLNTLQPSTVPAAVPDAAVPQAVPDASGSAPALAPLPGETTDAAPATPESLVE